MTSRLSHFPEQFLEQAPDGYVRFDTQGRFRWLNAAAAGFLDTSQEAVVGTLPTEVLAPDLGRRFEAHIHQALAEGRTVSLPDPLARDQSRQSFDVQFTPLLDDQGRAQAVMGQCREVSHLVRARKRQERQLRESEDRYRTLADLSPDAILVHDGETVLFANRSAVQFFGGQGPEDLVGASPLDLVHPEDRPQATERIRSLLEQGGDPQFQEQRLFDLQGRVLEVEVNGRRLTYGGAPAIQSVVRDIRQRKELERALRQERDLLRATSRIQHDLILEASEGADPVHEVCRLAVAEGGLALAWVGWAGPDGAVESAAACGAASDYIHHLRIRLDPSVPEGQGPTATAIREGRAVIVPDWDRDSRISPWRERAQEAGIRASAAFPLWREGEAAGALNVYASQPDAFTDGVVHLLEQLAGALGYALDRREKERQRRELADVVEATPDFVGIKELEGGSVYHNPAAREVLGLAADEAYRNHPIEESHPAWAVERVRDEGIPTALREGEWRGETALLDARGEEVPISQVIVAHPEPDGTVRRLSTIMRDLRPQKALEAQLRRKNWLMEAQQGTSPDGILVVDPTGRAQDFNQQFVTLWDLPEEVAQTKDSDRILALSCRRAADPEGFFNGVRELLADPSRVEEGVEVPLADGRVLERHTRPIEGEAGAFLGRVVFYRDITERKRREESLRQQREFHRGVLDSLTEGVIVIDTEARAVETNRAATVLTGFSRADFLGRDPHELLETRSAEAEAGPEPSDPDFPCPVKATLRDAQPRVGREVGIQRKDGATFEALMGIAPLVGEEGVEGAVLAFQDISDRKELERVRDRLVEILDASPDYVAMHNARSGRLVYQNPALLDLIGFPRIGDRAVYQASREVGSAEAAIREGHPPWAAEKVLNETIPQAMAKGYWAGESALLDEAGREVPVSQVTVAHTGEGGEVERLSTVMRDIRDRKRLEAQLTARQDLLADLHAVTAGSGQDLQQKFFQLLQLGVRAFRLPYGIVSRVDGQDYHIEQVVTPDASLHPGACFDLGDTFCSLTLRADGPTGFFHAGQSRINAHPAYRKQGMEAYLGVPLRVRGEVYGTLNFSSPEPREPLTHFELEFLQLLGRWVEAELERAFTRDALERERNLFVGGPTMVFRWQPEAGWPVTYCSPNVAEVFGYAPEELVQAEQGFAELIHPEDRPLVSERFRQHARQGAERFEQEYRVLRADGEFRWVYDFTRILRDEADVPQALDGYLLDITERKALEEELRYQASHDPLTGLLNRHQAEVILDREISRCARYGGPISLILADVDHFKTINDTYGHEAGDTALQAISRVLQERVRESDEVFRWGGEEFLLVLPETAREGAWRLAEFLREAVASTSLTEIPGLTLSLGVVTCDAKDPSRGELTRRVDQALYQAKGGGRNRTVEG